MRRNKVAPANIEVSPLEQDEQQNRVLNRGDSSSPGGTSAGRQSPASFRPRVASSKSDGSMRQPSDDNILGPRRERKDMVREGAITRGRQRQNLGVIGGLMAAEYDALFGASSLHGERVSTVTVWLRRAMVERQQKRGIRQNPSIVAVVHRYIEAGSDGFNEAKKIVDTPFPFPYAQAMVGLLLIFVKIMKVK